MAREFTPYPEIGEDIQFLLEHLEDPGCIMPRCSLHPAGRGPIEKRMIDRLLAAFKEPECGAKVHHLAGNENPALWWLAPSVSMGYVCRQPRDHEGPHVPDLPAEAWRMPDA